MVHKKMIGLLANYLVKKMEFTYDNTNAEFLPFYVSLKKMDYVQLVAFLGQEYSDAIQKFICLRDYSNYIELESELKYKCGIRTKSQQADLYGSDGVRLGSHVKPHFLYCGNTVRFEVS